MAQYDMTQQINKIAEIENKEVEQVAKELRIDTFLNEKWIAWNRREEGRVLDALRQAEEAKRAKELRTERLATFHWIKEAGEWVVAGNFEGKSAGDDIIVMKASGEKQEKRIVGFTGSGNAYVK